MGTAAVSDTQRSFDLRKSAKEILDKGSSVVKRIIPPQNQEIPENTAGQEGLTAEERRAERKERELEKLLAQNNPPAEPEPPTPAQPPAVTGETEAGNLSFERKECLLEGGKWVNNKCQIPNSQSNTQTSQTESSNIPVSNNQEQTPETSDEDPKIARQECLLGGGRWVLSVCQYPAENETSQVQAGAQSGFCNQLTCGSGQIKEHVSSGVCICTKTKKDDGDRCSAGADCKSLNCQSLPGGKFCVPAGQNLKVAEGTKDLGDWCDLAGDEDDRPCKPGLSCVQLRCQVPEELLQGSYCENSSDCASGVCEGPFGLGISKTCRGDGQQTTEEVAESGNKKRGEGCSDGSECESGNCANHWFSYGQLQYSASTVCVPSTSEQEAGIVQEQEATAIITGTAAVVANPWLLTTPIVKIPLDTAWTAYNIQQAQELCNQGQSWACTEATIGAGVATTSLLANATGPMGYLDNIILGWKIFRAGEKCYNQGISVDCVGAAIVAGSQFQATTQLATTARTADRVGILVEEYVWGQDEIQTLITVEPSIPASTANASVLLGVTPQLETYNPSGTQTNVYVDTPGEDLTQYASLTPEELGVLHGHQNQVQLLQ